MKIGIIGTVGVPARYGGFETLVHQLILNLKNHYELTIYCSGKAYKKEEQLSTWKGAKLKYIPLKANGIQSIFYDIWSMIHALIFCEALLVLGVSGCIILPFVKLFSSKKVIVNIDGLEWRRPKWGRMAKKFLLFSERIACKYADEIVTDNRILLEYVKIRYNINSRLIEYGADHTTKVPIQISETEIFPVLRGRYSFKVARIEPENNIHIILEAFSRMPKEKLVVVGNWENSSYGKKLKKKYKAFSNINLLDPIYENGTLNLLRSNASLYIHGHSAGGTNPSLVEAMYLGLPVISIDAIYNRITTNNQAIYFSGVEDLCQIVNEIDTYDLETIRYNLKQIANCQYTWERITELYSQVIEGKPNRAYLKPQLKPVFRNYKVGKPMPV